MKTMNETSTIETKIRSAARWLPALCFAATVAIALPACEEAEDAAEETTEAVEDTADDAMDAAEDAGDAVEETAEDLADGAEEAVGGG